MRNKFLLFLIFLYILKTNFESYDNLNDKLIFQELSNNINKDNIKERKFKLTRERSENIYNYLFNISSIINNEESLKDYLNRNKFINDNKFDELIIKKVNNYYNLNLNLNMSIEKYINVIKLNKLNDLGNYFNSNILINRIILNTILNGNSNKFDEYIISKLLDLNLISYENQEINKLLEEINYKLKSYIYYKFNKEYYNLIILESNKIRNLVFIGEINI